MNNTHKTAGETAKELLNKEIKSLAEDLAYESVKNKDSYALIENTYEISDETNVAIDELTGGETTGEHRTLFMMFYNEEIEKYIEQDNPYSAK